MSKAKTMYAAYLNGIEVGTISGREYREIRHRVFRDPMVYVLQGVNVMRALMKALYHFLLFVPVVSFWGLIALAMFDPASYTAMVSTFHADPQNLRGAAMSYFTTFLQFWLLVLVAEAAFFMRLPGFENRFRQAINDEVRDVLRFPAEGKIVLTPKVGFVDTEVTA